MSKIEKLILKILRGKSDANISFDDLRNLLLHFGFQERLMHRYEIIIYWSEEDQVFVAEVPELPGCAAHGDSGDQALVNCHEAISLWIDAAREFGRTIPEPKGRRLQYA